ncbi:MAG: diaminopimelate decarboxylase, partial [Polycyclovorans sp.]
MDAFTYRDGVLHAESLACTQLVKAVGTPCYVYSRAALTAAYQAFDEALDGHPHQIHFAVKANSNLAVLNLLSRLGSGFDIVSGGELQRVIAAGGDPRKVVFSGVGKTEAEMALALDAGIGCFNIESA